MTAPSLAERLSGTKEAVATAAPPELFAIFAGEQARLDTTTDRAGLVTAGRVAEPFALPDATGRTVELDALVAGGPAVVVLYRGAWCPYCNTALQAYQRELLPELTRLGVPLAAISPQGPDGSLTTAEKAGLTFPVLTDAGSAWARTLGVVFPVTDDVRRAQVAFGIDLDVSNAGGERELPMPTVLVVGPGRRVLFADVRPDYTTRTEPAAVLEAVRAAVPAEAGQG